MRSASQLREIGLAMHAYKEEKGHFPPAAVCDKDGTPLLSWRVLLLPYLEHEALFKQFKLDEPWDSPHNLKLLPLMPGVYHPVGEDRYEPHATFYQVFVGKGAAFEAGTEITLEEVSKGDGTSLTILVIEGGKAVPWTAPIDLKYDSHEPLPPVGGLFTGPTGWSDFRPRNDGTSAAFFDGHAQFLQRQISEEALRALITRNAGDRVHDE